MKGEDWELDAVDVVDDWNTGSHSMWKFGVNLGRGGGATRREIDHCGCWKSRDRQSDAYAEMTILFVDAKVANILAVGESCRVLCLQGQRHQRRVDRGPCCPKHGP